MALEFRNKMQGIVESKPFATTVQILILASTISLVIESELSARDEQGLANRIVQALEWLFLSIFALEYLLRVYAAPKRLKYIFSFYGIVDLIAILPSLMIFHEFAAIRLLRVMRAFKLIKSEPLILALDRLKGSFNAIKHELVVFSLISCILIFLSACGIHLFEADEQPKAFGTILKSIWWAFSTLTTIGFGDVNPETAGGKFFAGIVGFIGIAIIALPSGLLASALTRDRKPSHNDKHPDWDDAA